MARARLTLALVVAALVAGVASGVSGCFSPNEPICSFACADSDPKCPQDYVCASDGYCHLPGHESESCGFSDASVPIDMALRTSSDMVGLGDQ